MILLVRLFGFRPVFLRGFWTPLFIQCSVSWGNGSGKAPPAPLIRGAYGKREDSVFGLVCAADGHLHLL